MFTQEEIEYLKETLGEDWYRKIMEMSEQAHKAVQIETELKENLQKIFYNPEAKEHFIKALQKAEIPVDIPVDPYEKQIKELKKEVTKVKSTYEEEKMRQAIVDALSKYGITESEYEDLINFQKEYGITDNLKAIELYAQTRKQKGSQEFAPSKFVKSILEPQEYTEEVAYKKTMQELKKILG